MHLNLFIIGPSGSGKSTQARLIAEKYHLTHFSTGQLLRDEITSGSEIGLEAKKYVDQGTWAPDSVIFSVLKSHIDKVNDQNFIIDGFPRVLNQGIMVANYLNTINRPMTFLIHISVTFDEIIRRRKKMEVEGTRFSDAGRTDETPESILQRQLSYDETINPILNYFKEKHMLINIDGNRPVSPIFSDICQEIDRILTVNNN